MFVAFLRLGLTSFGGPVAHIGYFRAEFVGRRRWLDEAVFADIVALCQFLPGPASSQTGIAIGVMRAGLPGALAAWLGFTLPSALAMMAFGYGLASFGDVAGAAWLHGLKIVAVAVVAQAVWSMARNLCPDPLRAGLAIAATVVALAVPTAFGQIAAIVGGGLIGWRLLSAPAIEAHMPVPIGRTAAMASLAAFAVLLIGLPLLRAQSESHTLALIDSFYRSGALVFGGGHVVLPLLQAQVVPAGWVGNDLFLAGYGAAQALPGPLTTFAAFLGVVDTIQPNGWRGGMICLLAIFLPSFLLVIGALPFWGDLRRQIGVQSALRGINAAVVGLLLAALYTPVITSTIYGLRDAVLAVVAFLALEKARAPPWAVVLAGALVMAAITRV